MHAVSPNTGCHRSSGDGVTIDDLLLIKIYYRSVCTPSSKIKSNPWIIFRFEFSFDKINKLCILITDSP